MVTDTNCKHCKWKASVESTKKTNPAWHSFTEKQTKLMNKTSMEHYYI